MHETAIIEELIAAVEREVEPHGSRGRVVRVRVAVGLLSGASPEALRFAFERLTPATRLNGAAMEIVPTRATFTCRQCGAHAETEDLFAPCTRCHGDDVSIEGGRELLLTAIDFEEEP